MPYYERNLPHWLPQGKDLFVTWRLGGSLPVNVVEDLRSKKFPSEGHRFREFDTQLDAHRYGPDWLMRPQIAELVIAGLKKAEEEQLCRLRSYVVMPNHVHVLFSAMVPLERTMFLIKGRTARQANIALCRTGKPFWQNESFDHWIRNFAEFDRVRHYIESNPVKAGLAARPCEWLSSSASSTGFSRCVESD